MRSVLYTISPDGKSITCHNCGQTSTNPNDVANFYCGKCHAFFEDHPAAAPAIDPATVAPIVDRIRAVLKGKPPHIQGAVLADLVSMFLAGHPPALRETQLALLVDTARGMIEANEAILFQGRPRPPGWDEIPH